MHRQPQGHERDDEEQWGLGGTLLYIKFEVPKIEVKQLQSLKLTGKIVLHSK